MAGRKYIRIALTPDDFDRMQKAKASAEAGLSMTLTDSQFVLSLLRKALGK